MATIEPSTNYHRSPLQPQRASLLLLMLLGPLFLAACLTREQPPVPTATLDQSVFVNQVATPSPAATRQPTPTGTPDERSADTAGMPQTAPTIYDITANAGDYPERRIPRYEKFEITFQVETVAINLQWPYDPDPPAGIQSGIGVSVDALFTPDEWQTVYRQPAFYYQVFADEVKSGREWFYPTGEFAWKVRFAPDEVGLWNYKLVAQDAGGAYETQVYDFTVVTSDNRGFVRVSQADPRYFEYDNGSYFPALGYNLNYRRVDWINPVLANRETFAVTAENGIQLVRTWLSQWSIYGSAWSPWRSMNPDHNRAQPSARLRHDAVLSAGITLPVARPESEVFLSLSFDRTVSDQGGQPNFTPCVVMGWEAASIPVRRNSDYRVRVRYREHELAGPEVNGQPFGFVVKSGGWLWHNEDESRRCYAPGAGTVLAATYDTRAGWSHYPDPQHADWSILEGVFNSGEADFLNHVYLAIENATAGYVFIDYVWVEEKLSDGRYGPNLVYKPWMAHHQYFDQRNSYAFDKVLELAHDYEVYLKLVILEKNDYVFNIHELDGSLSPFAPNRNPRELFFGDGREMAGKTKTRWLQETWWRYLQARWGYSPNVHSWELLNEGDPGSALHYVLADELGKFFHQAFIPPDQPRPHPNRHLVTTSFWNRYPASFWGNDQYPYVDYADIHQYATESGSRPLDYIYEPDDFYDAALFSQKLSMYHGAIQLNGPGKPVMRGETGFLFTGPDLFAQNAADGLWLHNFIWAGVNSGGLIESYWIGAPTHNHIYRTDSHDHRPMFKPFYNFIQDVPLNNGRYQEAAAVVSHPDLRVWGQKDLVAGRAHLWLQNSRHTWRNVADGIAIPPVSGTVTLTGFQPGESYVAQWWDTYQPHLVQQIISTQTVTAQADGSLTLSVNDLDADVAVKILSP